MSGEANLNLLTELLQIPSPSGREERMAADIGRRIEALGWEARTDTQGNVWAEVAGRDNTDPVALASHTDEISMVITAIEASGDLRVQRSGGLFPFSDTSLLHDNSRLVHGLSPTSCTHIHDPHLHTVRCWYLRNEPHPCRRPAH